LGTEAARRYVVDSTLPNPPPKGGPRILWQERLKKVAQREAVKFEKVKKRISAKKPTLPRRGVVKWSRLIPGGRVKPIKLARNKL